MSETPLISVIVANFNSQTYISDAVQSALAQTESNIEIVVVDDASSDKSPQIIAEFAARDPRVRLERLAANGGPARARNRALELARGRFCAVMDADDLMHPDRLRRLLVEAQASGAQMIADDLLLFDGADMAASSGFLRGRRKSAPSWIGLDDYLGETLLLKSKVNLGYLKPMIERQAWIASGVRYDETLRIGEDDDLVLRLLACGLTYRLLPSFGYFYRRHSSSISHRLNVEAVDRMADQEARFRKSLADAHRPAPKGLDDRRRAVRETSAFVRQIDALKRRDIFGAAALAAQAPGSLQFYRMPIAARLARLVRALRPRNVATLRNVPRDGRNVCLISRQRLVGAVNGSSAYLLDLVRAMRDAGWRVHLIQPSPNLLGRWPVLALKPEMDVFASFSIRGVFRIGRYRVTRDIRILREALKAGVAAGFSKLSLPTAWLNAHAAPYAVTAPYEEADFLYLARTAGGLGDVVVLDYIFQADALPFLLPRTPKAAVVMHDLFHARTDDLSITAGKVGMAKVDEAVERALLGRADAVLAIQAAEGEWVRNNIPGAQVVLTPQAAHPVAEPQPGSDNLALFVGSNAAANIEGLIWFFDKVWPLVRTSNPQIRLQVAGSVARSIGHAPEGVELLGVVPDLSGVYRRAGVVISPLRSGSGLKIKLVEALAQGKAIVASSVTLQGVEDLVGPSVLHRDEPEAFAAAIIELCTSQSHRQALCCRALTVAVEHFSATASYGPMLNWLETASSKAGDASGPP